MTFPLSKKQFCPPTPCPTRDAYLVTKSFLGLVKLITLYKQYGPFHAYTYVVAT